MAKIRGARISASSSQMTRRRFLQDAAMASGAVALGAIGARQAVLGQSTLPHPGVSGIDHIVVLMMENRSFDHFLGWAEGADGRQHGLRYVDKAGAEHRTYPLAPDFQGCAYSDP